MDSIEYSLKFEIFIRKFLFHSLLFLLIIPNAISDDIFGGMVKDGDKIFQEMTNNNFILNMNNMTSAAFESLKNIHKRSYSSEQENLFRKGIFLKVLQHIFRNVLLRIAGKINYDTGMNQFFDMNREEAVQKHCGLVKSKRAKRCLNQTERFSRQKRGTDSIPDQWDWREHNLVTPVKDQKSCGCCWSFATNCALESHLMKAEMSQKKSTDVKFLSEQNLIDCSQSYGTDGCNGGDMIDAYNYIKNNGIMSSSDYPYVERDGKQCSYKSDKNVGSCGDYVQIEPHNEEDLKKAIYLKGPVCGAVCVTDDFLRYRLNCVNLNLSQGIFDDKACPLDREDVNHAVCIVGYGITDNIGYWIVKNSWGRMWGEDGYIRIKNKNTCNIASYCGYPNVANNIDTDKSWMAHLKPKKKLQSGSSTCSCDCQ